MAADFKVVGRSGNLVAGFFFFFFFKYNLNIFSAEEHRFANKKEHPGRLLAFFDTPLKNFI